MLHDMNLIYVVLLRVICKVNPGYAEMVIGVSFDSLSCYIEPKSR